MKNFICFFLIFVLALQLCSGCAKRKEKQPKTSPEALVDQKVLQFNLTGYTDKGSKSWEVEGRSANVIDQIVELKDVVARTYGKKNTLAIKADRGAFNKAVNKVHLEKNVVATTSDGAVVTTDAMDWDSSGNIITTDKRVKIEREEITLWGRGVIGEPELKTVVFDKNVRIEMYKGSTVITCDGPLNVDYEKDIAVFNNNVKIVDEKGEVTSDKLDAYLNRQTKAIVKAIAKGNVKILRGENSSASDEAIYLAEERRVILTGRPEIVIYPGEKFDPSMLETKGE